MKSVLLRILIFHFALLFSLELSAQKKTENTDAKKASDLYDKAIKKLEKDDLKGAIKDFDAAIAIKPTFFEAYFNRATAKMNSEDYPGAIADYEETLKINPDFIAAILNKAAIKGKMKEYDAGIQELDGLLETHPHYAKAFTMRGQMKKLSKDLNGACADFTNALMFGDKAADIQFRTFCTKSGAKAPITQKETFNFSLPDSLGFSSNNDPKNPNPIQNDMMEGFFKKTENDAKYTVKAVKMNRKDLVDLNIEAISTQIFEEQKQNCPLIKMTQIDKDEKSEFMNGLYSLECIDTKKYGSGAFTVLHIIKGYKNCFVTQITYKNKPESQEDLTTNWTNFFKELKIEYK
jgi:tetratricopeptide (TPR) repeat protein